VCTSRKCSGGLVPVIASGIHERLDFPWIYSDQKGRDVDEYRAGSLPVGDEVAGVVYDEDEVTELDGGASEGAVGVLGLAAEGLIDS